MNYYLARFIDLAVTDALAGLGCLLFTLTALGVVLSLRNIAVPYFAAYR